MERLRRSDAFEAEIRDLLARAKFEPEVVDRVLERLRELRVLNDSRAVEETIRRRANGSKARGAEALRQELLRRGAPEEEIERQISQIPPETIQAQLLDLLSKKCKIADSRERAARLLLSRGFSEEEVETALTAFFESPEAKA